MMKMMTGSPTSLSALRGLVDSKETKANRAYLEFKGLKGTWARLAPRGLPALKESQDLKGLRVMMVTRGSKALRGLRASLGWSIYSRTQIMTASPIG